MSLPPPCLTWGDVFSEMLYCNGTHNPKSSTFVLSIHRIYSQKPFGSSRGLSEDFMANVRRAIVFFWLAGVFVLELFHRCLFCRRAFKCEKEAKTKEICKGANWQSAPANKPCSPGYLLPDNIVTLIWYMVPPRSLVSKTSSVFVYISWRSNLSYVLLAFSVHLHAN